MVMVRGHLGDDEAGRLGHGKVEVEVEVEEEKKAKVKVDPNMNPKNSEVTLMFSPSEFNSKITGVSRLAGVKNKDQAGLDHNATSPAKPEMQ
ncbi:MAG: hypothetical protein A2268_15275 [Candidatus Raymondbacteria bacterium RifOxyA12_full_50_37]|uniref:Uncharacterized protein n=1 Tax=Candidatus Raymondbacteria bacterium RIFOXYD12_FULL_49_13 TaxID=1817890 RepID=A0A1F7F6Q2_UNCRA|nr:MAG: hypothetical protein A2268_15275 [Candidatus Raymondbacteria bacterium RifOxyA12_full_50_37]OGJ88485.1 MAG: hypothetical protein A2248_19990 [Candidatus Raymondbacteria bacterium RIFOXYA2_FULL_49_16]OGJ90633.1 MAG: hypothetical protein A2350_18525 [Candidatus Raymondbacteria bacterium RifOxyB12_full_50_8]OGJ96203.1 MAG: hypothetical protein A2487_01455 [Candidatus Raymondbacteria bacterium RifOxyC12_full_50_8]OGJ98945.1 MAG: hypothetical protein A2453_10705 [Candidatus Raymondbacteria b